MEEEEEEEEEDSAEVGAEGEAGRWAQRWWDTGKELGGGCGLEGG